MAPAQAGAVPTRKPTRTSGSWPRPCCPTMPRMTDHALSEGAHATPLFTERFGPVLAPALAERLALRAPADLARAPRLCAGHYDPLCGRCAKLRPVAEGGGCVKTQISDSSVRRSPPFRRFSDTIFSNRCSGGIFGLRGHHSRV